MSTWFMLSTRTAAATLIRTKESSAPPGCCICSVYGLRFNNLQRRKYYYQGFFFFMGPKAKDEGRRTTGAPRNELGEWQSNLPGKWWKPDIYPVYGQIHTGSGPSQYASLLSRKIAWPSRQLFNTVRFIALRWTKDWIITIKLYKWHNEIINIAF